MVSRLAQTGEGGNTMRSLLDLFQGTGQKTCKRVAKAIALLCSVGLSYGIRGLPAQALPGETVRDVQAWIQSHPTLKPEPGESLVVNKSDTPAQRFSFEASIFPPFPSSPKGSRIIRHESVELFDMINGVQRNRLEESLRVVFGLDIYQDYQRAQSLYRYPQPVELDRLQGQVTDLQKARQGELRLGDRYGYWVEIVQTPQGRPYNGQIVVLLKEDVDGLEAQLRQ